MRILFLSHYYPPEVNAPASRLGDNARAWVAAGHDVTVVTCAPNHPAGTVYPGYRNVFSRTVEDGVTVIRLPTYVAANRGFGRRLANYLSYPLSLWWHRRRLPDSDVVVSTSPQFFCGLAGRLLQRRDRPWVLEIRDIWPDSIVAVGAMRKSAAIRLLERIERWAYRTADGVVAVTDSFVDHIASRRGRRDIAVVKNGVDTAFYRTPPGATVDALRAALGVTGKTVAAYVGTHGMAHGLDTILASAARLKDRDDIVFLLVGDGSERERLVAKVADLGLDNVRIAGQRPKSDMPALWALTDISLIHLRRQPAFEQVLPSKMFEAMALARPIVLGVAGEAARLLDAAGAGVAIPPEDDAAMADAVRLLADDPARRAALGTSGQAYVRTHFERRVLADLYADYLADFVAAKRSRA